MASNSTVTDRGAVSELLLACLRGDWRLRESRRFFKASPAQWTAAVEEAVRQGVAPALYLDLKTQAAERGIPPGALQKLRDHYLFNAAKNLRLYHSFSTIAASLKNQGIPVIPLKGVYLAEAVYGGQAERSIGDIDLLVKEKDFEQADRALLALGYRPRARRRAIFRDIFHLGYREPDTGLIVEIHWNLLPRGPAGQVDVGGLWRRAKISPLAGYKVLALCPEDQILFLCAHITRHAFQGGLRSLSDIFEVIRYFDKEMDWKIVTRRAGQWGTCKSAYFGLRLAQELFHADVPDRCLAGLRPKGFGESLYHLARAEIVAPRHPHCEELRLNRNVARLWQAGGWAARIRYFFKRTFPPGAEMARLYPVRPGTAKLFWYYPYRVAGLLARQGRGAWRRFLGDKETIAFTKQEKALNALGDWIEAP